MMKNIGDNFILTPLPFLIFSILFQSLFLYSEFTYPRPDEDSPYFTGETSCTNFCKVYFLVEIAYKIVECVVWLSSFGFIFRNSFIQRHRIAVVIVVIILHFFMLQILQSGNTFVGDSNNIGVGFCFLTSLASVISLAFWSFITM